jgi:hypothetical protein
VSEGSVRNGSIVDKDRSGESEGARGWP